MPNKTIYFNTIEGLEKDIGFSFIDKEAVAKRLQEAWKKDDTREKFGYLAEYREVFRHVLKTWCDRELSTAFQAMSETKPDFKKCLLKTDKALKLSALSLIPELKEDENTLFHMTFGVIDPTKLKNEFFPVQRPYLTHRAAEKAMQQRKAEAYEKYKKEWGIAPTINIAELVRDKAAVAAMSQKEKIDYALALEAYRNDDKAARPLDERGKGLVDDALTLWRKEIGCARDESLDEFVAGQYFQYAQTLDEKWLDNEVESAITEYNKTPDSIKQEIAHYKELEAAAIKKERTIRNEGVTDESAEMVGDFFREEELKHEIAEEPSKKERLFFEEHVTKFNAKYSQHVNKDKVRTSIEQVSALMIKAREEKERFLSKSSVVVIENGKETCYEAKEYFQETIKSANKSYVDKIMQIEEQRALAEKEHQTMLEKIEKQKELVAAKDLENMKAEREKTRREKNAEFDKARDKAKQELEEALSTTEGGIVIEKEGDAIKRSKASQYYETHETKKEQYAYGEYQKMFARLYRDSAINLKEQNYAKGQVTDFSVIAKDVDKMLKSAMFISNVYENEKNREIVQKCNFGGFSAEQLASFVEDIPGDSWALNQASEAAWSKQLAGAKNVLSGWQEEWNKNPKEQPSKMIKTVLEANRAKFEKCEITRKEMLDSMIAAEAHMQRTYPTRAKKIFSFIKYGREKNALNDCRDALSMHESMSLRLAMNYEYERMRQSMSKEEVYKSIGKQMYGSLSFQEEKQALAREHQAVQDKVVAQKMAELEALRLQDKEPKSVTELDEKQVILHQKPRVQPITTQEQPKPNLNLSAN